MSDKYFINLCHFINKRNCIKQLLKKRKTILLVKSPKRNPYYDMAIKYDEYKDQNLNSFALNKNICN